jgi:enediyne biosynthesis protein E4
LRGDGKGHFTPVPPYESGFLAPGKVSGLALINTPTGKAVLVANTGDSLQAFTIQLRQHGTGTNCTSAVRKRC